MGLLHGNTDLSSREWAVTALIARGCTNAEIAIQIHTNPHDIENHLRRILEKTGCWNRTEVALWYSRIGVETERRIYDRRAEAHGALSYERRRSDRRQTVALSPRAKEQHDINLDE